MPVKRLLPYLVRKIQPFFGYISHYCGDFWLSRL